MKQMISEQEQLKKLQQSKKVSQTISRNDSDMDLPLTQTHPKM
jgi:hypothetical protein